LPQIPPTRPMTVLEQVMQHRRKRALEAAAKNAISMQLQNQVVLNCYIFKCDFDIFSFKYKKRLTVIDIGRLQSI